MYIDEPSSQDHLDLRSDDFETRVLLPQATSETFTFKQGKGLYLHPKRAALSLYSWNCEYILFPLFKNLYTYNYIVTYVIKR